MLKLKTVSGSHTHKTMRERERECGKFSPNFPSVFHRIFLSTEKTSEKTSMLESRENIFGLQRFLRLAEYYRREVKIYIGCMSEIYEITVCMCNIW